jgi:hypothetical protein
VAVHGTGAATQVLADGGAASVTIHLAGDDLGSST